MAGELTTDSTRDIFTDEARLRASAVGPVDLFDCASFSGDIENTTLGSTLGCCGQRARAS